MQGQNSKAGRPRKSIPRPKWFILLLPPLRQYAHLQSTYNLAGPGAGRPPMELGALLPILPLRRLTSVGEGEAKDRERESERSVSLNI